MITLGHWALALVVAMVLSMSYHLDGPSDTQAAQDVADYAAELASAQAHIDARPDLLADLQDADPDTAQQRAAAARLCHYTRGSTAQLLTLADGSTVCRAGVKQSSTP